MSWLRHALGSLVVPAIAERPGVSVWFMSTGEAGWIHRTPGCPVPEPGFPRVHEAPEPGGAWERHDLPMVSEPGTLWACLEAGATTPDELPRLVEAARTIAELRERQALLEEELELTYENLSSVYEISANPELLLDPERALDLVLERLGSFDEGLEAVIWSVEGGRLRPRRWRANAAPAVRDAREGFLGQVLRTGRTLVDNHWCAARGDLPEFRGARRVAAAPIGLQGSPFGVLAMGNEAPGRFDGRQLALLSAFATQVAMVIENEGLRRREAAAIRATNEIEIAARMQQVLLHADPPVALPGLDLGVASVAARGADGDFFEFFTHPSGALDVLVGDVMGKGLPAALVGAAVKSEFLRYGSIAGLEAEGVREPDIARVVQQVHAVMSPRLVALDCFVTGTHHRIEADGDRLTYVDCGHVPPMIVAADGTVRQLRREWESLTNLPLGLAEETHYESVSETLALGDVLVLYSDGLTEARGPDEEMFGAERLVEALRKHRDAGAQEIADALKATVTAFTGTRGLGDDLTCVVIRRIAGCIETRRFSPELSRLTAVRRFLDEAARRAPWLETDAVARNEVVVAGVEWASNVMRHAFPDGDVSHPFTLSVRAAADELVIEIRDRGRSFSPEAIPDPDLDEPVEGGVGLFLVHALMDHVEYDRLEDGSNRVRLTRRCNASRRVRAEHPPGR